jgi:hypothetical protein
MNANIGGLPRNQKVERDRKTGQVWWLTPVIPAFWRLRKEAPEFETSLDELHTKLFQKQNQPNKKSGGMCVCVCGNRLKTALPTSKRQEEALHRPKRLNLPVLVVHTRNPSYSGGRDQKDCGSNPAPANSA